MNILYDKVFEIGSCQLGRWLWRRWIGALVVGWSVGQWVSGRWSVGPWSVGRWPVGLIKPSSVLVFTWSKLVVLSLGTSILWTVWHLSSPNYILVSFLFWYLFALHLFLIQWFILQCLIWFFTEILVSVVSIFLVFWLIYLAQFVFHIESNELFDTIYD